MKKLLLSTAALALVALAAPASAADLAARPYTKAPAYAPAAPIYNWTGFYIGGHIGGAFPGNDDAVLGNRDGTFMGGVQGGYDYQFAPNWVFGLEANYSFLSTSSNFDNRGLGSVTGRLGYTWGPALLYVKGGYAWADSRFTNGFAGAGGRDSRGGHPDQQCRDIRGQGLLRYPRRGLESLLRGQCHVWRPALASLPSGHD